jgi:rhodanese-related sulfurtransferase
MAVRGMRACFGVGILVVTLAAGCNGVSKTVGDVEGAKNIPPIVWRKVDKARGSVKTVDMAVLKAAVDKPGSALIVDVREPGEYSRGHIPGAVNVPRGSAEFAIWKEVGFPGSRFTGTLMYVYSDEGGRAVFAAGALSDLGFRNVHAVKMKLEDWKKAGNPMK